MSVGVLETVWEEGHYNVWQETRNMENYEMYEKVKKEVKKVASDAKFKEYDGLYNRLGTGEGYL